MSQAVEENARAFRWAFGNVEFDESRWELTVAGVAVELERKPLGVLAYLLRHAGEVVTKDELLEGVWPNRVVVEAALTNAIGKLRRGVGEAAAEMIVTVSKVGYRLDAPVKRQTVVSLPPESRLVAGHSVPRRPHWKLVDRLARHGDGEVWRAVHAKTGDVRVFKFSLDGQRLGALKREVTLARVLRDSLGDREDLVRIIDWDFEEAPFFLEAEFGGTALDLWAAEDDRLGRLALSDRLALVKEVAGALAAAHDVGVLHKDIKPANLLIWERDGTPHARVADFGSGRLLDPEQLESLGITQLGLTHTQAFSSDSLTGTPLYLAPEVVGGQAPSIKSDLYALGVVFYQLVVGDLRRPMSPGWEADVADPLLREDMTMFANGDPARRPASAHELVTRLSTLGERRLLHDTETAVRQRIADNERRLARARARRPWAIAAMVLLVVGLVLITRLYNEARDAQVVALEERDTARALNRFLQVDILGSADPFSAGRPDITMREALDRGASRIDRRFALQPKLAAPMHETVAQAYAQLSDYSSSAGHFAAAATARSRIGLTSKARAVADRALALEARSRGAPTTAAPTMANFDEVAKQIDQLPAVDQHDPRIYLDRAIAWDAFERLDFAAAVTPLEDALVQMSQMPDVDPDLEASIQQAHAMALAHVGAPTAQVIALQRKAMARHQASASATKIPMALSARYAIARMRMIAGDERLMETEYREIIAELIQVLGPRTEATLLAQHGLAHIFYKQGRWDDCKALEARTVLAMQEVLGPVHLSTINAGNTLAVCNLAAGDPRTAALELAAALKALGSGNDVRSNLIRVVVQLNMAHAQSALGNWPEVEHLLASVQRDGSKLLKLDTDGEGEFDLLQGQLLAAHQQPALAIPKIRQAIALLRKKNPEDFWLVLRGQQLLSKLGTHSANTLGTRVGRPAPT